MTKKSSCSIHFINLFLVMVALFFSTGTPAIADIIIDNGNPGTSSTGIWSLSGGAQFYGSNSLWSRNGTTYTWQFSAQPAGLYEVLMWWSSWSSRATSVPVLITHNTGQTPLTINQRENAGQWNSLGQYHFDSSGSVTITAAYGFSVSTCADAVWFRFIDGNTPPSATIDSIAPNPANPGQTVAFTGHGTDDGTVAGYRWESDIDGLLSTAAIFNTSSLSEAAHIISFTVQDDDGAWSEAVTQLLSVGTGPTEITIDNRDANTARTGTWSVSNASDSYGVDALWSRGGTTFTWYFIPSHTGEHEVSLWWTQAISRASSIPVSITHDGGSAVLTVNQQQNGGQWNSLGEYTFTAGVRYPITITSQAYPTTTCADAVKVVYSGGGALCGNNIVEGTEQCDGGACCTAACTFAPAGTPCPDSVYCDGAETCNAAGVCLDAAPVNCSDGVSCTTDVCNEGTDSCVHTPNNAFCSNSQYCDGAEVCNPVSGCQPGSPVTCSANGSYCDGTEYCNEASDSCVSTGNPCAAGMVCNETSDSCVAALVCGNGVREGTEECDSSDDAACPGLCESDCTCGTPPPEVCGNDIREGSEECDGSDDAACPGLCLGNCSCALEIIIDNGDPGTSRTGTWTTSGAPLAYPQPGGTSLYSNGGSTYTWTFTPALTAPFRVFMWHTYTASRSNHIPVSIQHRYGTDTVYVNQQIQAGQFNLLGEYYFQAGGSYRVTITAQPYPTSTCADAVMFQQINLTDPPVVEFTADKTFGGAPFTIQFTDRSTGLVTGRLWDFGDGHTSTEQNPSHEYDDMGLYTVSLSATNAIGTTIKTWDNYIDIVPDIEHIYLCDGYSNDALFLPWAEDILEDLGAVYSSGRWTYYNPVRNITHIIHEVRDPRAMENALRGDWNHIIFNGHSNYGLGPSFATASEVFNQVIGDIYYVDDDDFAMISTDMVSVKVDGMQESQAYPNWEPYLSNGNPALAPYSADEGMPPYNYYLQYQIPGSPEVYIVERADGTQVQRFPDSQADPWDWPNGTQEPDPILNPEYFITNPGDEFNHAEYTGTWAKAGQCKEEGTECLGYNYHYSAPGTGSDIATWYFVIKGAGNYAVQASWESAPGNATNAKYIIHHNGPGSPTTFEANQTVNTETGWNDLGTYHFDMGYVSVQLNDYANGTVLADAVQLVYLENPDDFIRAEFSPDVRTGGAPLSVTFTSRSSATEAITAYSWDFGDGSASDLQYPVHTYAAPGIYTVSLTVTDAMAREHTEIKEDLIVVGGVEAPLHAEFYSRYYYRGLGSSTRFYDLSSGTVTGWHWDFGDGETSNEQNPRHVYPAIGTYNVSLTVTGPDGTDTETETGLVAIILADNYTDNSDQYKAHFQSRSSTEPSVYGKVVVYTGDTKVPEEEMRYHRVFFGSCNSCSYYAGTLSRGTLICSTSDQHETTAHQYLEYYLLGYGFEEILNGLNAMVDSHVYELINFNQKPPSLR